MITSTPAAVADTDDGARSGSGRMLITKEGALTVIDARTGATLKSYPNAIEGHWSPDMQRITFTAEYPSSHVWVMNADGSNPQRVVRTSDNGLADFSNDGKWLVYRTCDDEWSPWVCNVFKIRSTAPFGKPVQITHAESAPDGVCAGFEADYYGDPSWNPVNNTIAVGHGCYDSGGDKGFAEVVDADTGKVLARGAFDGDEASWSPDGTRLAWSELILRQGWYLTCIRLSSADLRSSHRLTPCSTNRTRSGRWPQWSPDGSRVAWFAGFATDSDRIVAAKADGTGQMVISRGYTPLWDWRR